MQRRWTRTATVYFREGLNVSLLSFTYLSHLVSSNPKPPQNWGLVSGAPHCWARFLSLVAPLPGAGLLPVAGAEARWGLGAGTGAHDSQGLCDFKPHNKPKQRHGHPSDKTPKPGEMP